MNENNLKNKPTLKEKIQYRFDNVMSSGMRAKIGILFLVTLIIGLFSGIMLLLFAGKSGHGFWDAIWISYMHVIDPGTLAGDDGQKSFIFIMLFATIAGMILTSTLVGVVNNGLESKMNELRQGRSRVLEKRHTIVLGFNEITFTILEELIEANSNHTGCAIVVMDEVEKVEMEDAIQRRIPDTRTTKIICRKGSAFRMDDIRICSPETCKAIVLNTEDDFNTIKSLLACSTVLNASDNDKAFITACVRDESNIEAARIAAQGRAELLYFKTALSRIMAQTCREPGLTHVFTELFNFDGDELYREYVEGMEGKTLGEINLYFKKSTAIGFVRPDPENPDKDMVLVNPDALPGVDPHMQPGDDLILLEEDDGSTKAEKRPGIVQTEYFSEVGHSSEDKDIFLVLGSSPILKDVLLEEDHYVLKGSTAYIFDSDRIKDNLPDPDSLENLQVVSALVQGDIVTKDDLEYILVSEKEKNITSILVLSNPDLDDEEADSRTLTTLLNLRNIADMNPDLNYTITSQMNSVKNQELAEIARVNDFVVSNNIVALLMSQISETRELNEIFEILLSDRDSEIYMKKAKDYVKLGVPVNTYTVTASAARYKEVPIGYKIYDNDTDYRVIINPEKSMEICFTDRDHVIVVA